MTEPTLYQLACGLLELRDRIAALEAAGSVAGNSGHAPATPAGVSAEELADCLPANAWAGPEGYSRQACARHLLDHPRIGLLLRGEGAGVPKRVVLPEELAAEAYIHAAAPEYRQQGGQADG